MMTGTSSRSGKLGLDPWTESRGANQGWSSKSSVSMDQYDSERAEDRRDNRKGDEARQLVRAVMDGGVRWRGHCMVQHPPFELPCEAYGSSFRATVPHTDGT